MSEQIKSAVGTVVRVFFAAVLAQTVAVGGDLSGESLRTVVAAGVAAAATVVFNWLNPSDSRYGIGS